MSVNATPGSFTSGAAPQATSPLPLIIGLFAGPILWMTHIGVSEIIVSFACAPSPGIVTNLIYGFGGWRTMLILVSLLFIVAAAAADFTAIHCWRKSGIGIRVTGFFGGASGRTGWMSLAGILLSSFFLFAIVLAAVPLVWFGGCGT
jgi:hypothetical protein